MILSWCIISCVSLPDGNEGTVRNVMGRFNGEPVIPRRANRIFVQEFADFNGTPAIAHKTTLRVVDRILQDGRLSVVRDIRNADVALIGEITRYELQPIAYDQYRQPVKKRIRIIAVVKLYNKTTGTVIFEESPVQSFRTFSDTAPPIESEYQAKEHVIEELARRIVAKAISGWYTERMTPVEKGIR